MRFRILSGAHEQNGKLYHRGDVVESPYDLVALFVNKFERLPDAPAPAPVPSPTPAPSAVAKAVSRSTEPLSPATQGQSTPPAGKPAETSKNTTAEDVEKDPVPEGKEVTNSFRKAREQDYRVWKRDGLYFIYDVDNLYKPINPDGAASRADVDAVVEAAVK